MPKFEPIRDLKSLLSQTLLSSAYDSSSTLPETFVIDEIAGAVADWEVGDMSLDELLQTVESHNLGDFDFQQWLRDMEEAGHYALD